MKNWLIILLFISIIIGIYLFNYYHISVSEKFRYNVVDKINNKRMVIRKSGDYVLDSNTTYYFDLEKNNSYLLNNKARDMLSLYLPTNVKDGDIIVLIDKNDRFGWGNLSYDIKIVLGNDTEIIGDLSDKNLFRFRGGNIILIWNAKKNRWESNGTKGTIINDWNGWYDLVYKGYITNSSSNINSIFPSYMRIDATQNPVLITVYGGTKMYPINIIVKSLIGDLDEDNNTIKFPMYPKNLTDIMNSFSPEFRRLKNGIILDDKNGGGWMKNNNISLTSIPPNFHELN